MAVVAQSMGFCGRRSWVQILSLFLMSPGTLGVFLGPDNLRFFLSIENGDPKGISQLSCQIAMRSCRERAYLAQGLAHS